ncbi:MAG: polysaccharide biosynthesis/export family protein [Bacteroidales bacterium]|nr:polysaccharide biosynthesis/export family protein [Bacteroidales bacterium]MCD8394043.1 polysaccharide biosynthesis/export family protein [Bacteroidales bacterium]
MKLITSCCALVAALSLITSCSAPKKVAYIEDAEEIPAEVLAATPNLATENTLQPGDLLNIEVTGTNYAAVAPFNKGFAVDAEGKVTQFSHNNNIQGETGEKSTRYYLVDNNGDITFPIIGTVHVAGLTKSQVSELIASEIYPKYLKEKPVVDVRFMNFRVTVLGAVKTPGVKTSQNESFNIFEALATAGDMDIKADRENIILVRTDGSGRRQVHKIDVHDKNLLLSPYYYLQPNDILIVNWNRSGAQQAWQMNNGFNTAITIVGGLSGIVGLIIALISL